MKSPVNRLHKKQKLRPSFRFEKTIGDGVCGIDEAGRAPLAGPVVAACVYIPPSTYTKSFWQDINDSKLLSKAKREELFTLVQEHAYTAIAQASVQEIEELNILQASLLAMRRAYEALFAHAPCRIAHALIDGNKAPKLDCTMETVVKGDGKSISIAAASVMAKVHRDRLMHKLSLEYPHYGWERNAGYATRDHKAGLEKFGITPHHRKTFSPVRFHLEASKIKKIA